MRRTNIFKLKPTKEQERKLFELADNCSKLWNEINYRRRQSFFKGEIDWNTDEVHQGFMWNVECNKVLPKLTCKQACVAPLFS